MRPPIHSQHQITIGTRGSALALWQAEHIANLLRAHYPDLTVTLQTITTRGDENQTSPLATIGGKGIFTAEIERALQDRTIDCAVHSLKDLPTESDPMFTLAAIPARANPFDALISRNRQPLSALPHGARIGTSSPRRAAQLRAVRPDLVILPLRGNVPTRVAKLMTAESAYDGIILACAGLERLNLADQIAEVFTPDVMLPAPGQGALAVQCRADNLTLRERLAALDHHPTRLAVTAERALLRGLEAGCSVPVAALCTLNSDSVGILSGRVASMDDQPQVISLMRTASLLDLAAAEALGSAMAAEFRAAGVSDWLGGEGE